MSRDAQILVDALRDPESVLRLDSAAWTDLISIARAEVLIGNLAHRLTHLDLPERVQLILNDAMASAEHNKMQALWEAECARSALVAVDCKMVLMKGAAYAAAGFSASKGRNIGDLDIMVARDKLPKAEEALLDAGWEWVKPDPYDDQYYRDHMHELPPLIHRDRDGMIDVHHTILPLTAGPTPDAGAMLDGALELNNGLYVMSPVDMTCHCAAHVMADGDLAGGLRNLWDFHCLTTEFAARDDGFWNDLKKRAAHHELQSAVLRAARYAEKLYGTAVPKDWRTSGIGDFLYNRRLLARDGYGRETRKFTRLLFYIRSHWLRMPPLMLAKHLWTKWRKG